MFLEGQCNACFLVFLGWLCTALSPKVARTSAGLARQWQVPPGPACISLLGNSRWFAPNSDLISVLIDANLDAKLRTSDFADSDVETSGLCLATHSLGIFHFCFPRNVAARCRWIVHPWKWLQTGGCQVAKLCNLPSSILNSCLGFTLLVQKLQRVDEQWNHSFATGYERTRTNFGVAETRSNWRRGRLGKLGKVTWFDHGTLS